MTQMGPDDIRRGLRDAAARRGRAKHEEQAALREMAEWAIEAQQTPGLTMTEAAGLLGMSRDTAYTLLAWHKGEQPNRA